MEACSQCHERIHGDERGKAAEAECRACHSDYGRGHIVAGIKEPS